MSNVLTFPTTNTWVDDSIEGCCVTVEDNNRPLTVEAVIYLLEMSKLRMLRICENES